MLFDQTPKINGSNWNWSEGGTWVAFKETNNFQLCFKISWFDLKYLCFDGVATYVCETWQNYPPPTLLMLIIISQPHIGSIVFLALCVLEIDFEEEYLENLA